MKITENAQSWSRKSTDYEPRKTWETVRGKTEYPKSIQVNKAASFPDAAVFKILRNTEGKLLSESEESITKVEQRQQDEKSSTKYEKTSKSKSRRMTRTAQTEQINTSSTESKTKTTPKLQQVRQNTKTLANRQENATGNALRNKKKLSNALKILKFMKVLTLQMKNV